MGKIGKGRKLKKEQPSLCKMLHVLASTSKFSQKSVIGLKRWIKGICAK